MSVYHGNEFLCALPDGLKDKTLNIFSLTEEGPSDFSVVITRERNRLGEDLETYVERHLAHLHARLPLFRTLAQKARLLDKAPAIACDFCWQSPEGKMFQRQVIVYSSVHRQVIHITATCKGDDLPPRFETMLEELLQSFRLRS